MITYISCSKTMVNQLSGQHFPAFTTTPLFETTAREFAMQLCQIPQEELAEALKVSPAWQPKSCYCTEISARQNLLPYLPSIPTQESFSNTLI